MANTTTHKLQTRRPEKVVHAIITVEARPCDFLIRLCDAEGVAVADYVERHQAGAQDLLRALKETAATKHPGARWCRS